MLPGGVDDAGNVLVGYGDLNRDIHSSHGEIVLCHFVQEKEQPLRTGAQGQRCDLVDQVLVFPGLGGKKLQQRLLIPADQDIMGNIGNDRIGPAFQSRVTAAGQKPARPDDCALLEDLVCVIVSVFIEKGFQCSV